MSDPVLHLALPLLSATVIFTAAASLLVRCFPGGEATRVIAALSLILAVGLLGGATWMRSISGQEQLIDPLWWQLKIDSFNETILILYAVLSLMIVLVAPRRDATSGFLAGVLWMFAATVIAYGATNLAGLVAGWWLTGFPFAFGWLSGPEKRTHRLVVVAVALSGLALAGAAFLLGPSTMDFSHGNTLALALLMLAVALRKGMFPAHSWLAGAFEKGSPLATVLFYNGHLGALLLVRAESTHLQEAFQQILHYLNWGALFTALYTSFLMIAERNPRRILALLCVSQAAFIFAGLSSSSHYGITGALIHWLVVAVASTGLVSVYRALEVRFAGVKESRHGHLGLAAHAPRLAVFFVVCGLALVGLPGTLGYCAEDLLFHGALESQPVIGIALILSTALNAIHLFRLFSRLFLGRLRSDIPEVPDALARERWPLSVCVGFLIVAGLVPSFMVRHREPVAEKILSSLGLEEKVDH